MPLKRLALSALVTLSLACATRPSDPIPDVPHVTRIPPQALLDYCDHVAEEAHDALRAELAPIPTDPASAERAGVAYRECLAARGY